MNKLKLSLNEISDNFWALEMLGYGDHNSRGGKGSPVVISRCDGKLCLHVWADINQEDPIHIIDLEGARESMRDRDS